MPQAVVTPQVVLPADGVTNRVAVEVEITFQQRGESLDVMNPDVGDQVGVVGHANHAVGNGSDSPPDEVIDLQLLEGTRNKQRGV